MVHVLASIGFSLVALATLSFIVLMLAASREAIMAALGRRPDPSGDCDGRCRTGPDQVGRSLAGHADGVGTADSALPPDLGIGHGR